MPSETPGTTLIAQKRSNLQGCVHNNFTTIKINIFYIHTYIIGRYNPSAAQAMCVLLISECQDLQVNVERQIFMRYFLMAVLFSLRVFARNLIAEEIFFFHISF